MNIKNFITIFLLFQCCFTANLFGRDTLHLIPQPVQVIQKSGKYILPKNISLVLNTDSRQLKELADRFGHRLSLVTGYPVVIHQEGKNITGAIYFNINEKENSTIGGEGYTLLVQENGIHIAANTPAGIFYGTKTLLQLMPPEIESNQRIQKDTWTIPAVEIVDYPRFGWRGMLLDVARHFFTTQQVKGFIDNMVKYKYNLLHLHLTDDQGWRLQIKSLPKLTEIGAWRAPRVGRWTEYSKPSPEEPRTYGGFYTHDEIKDIIQYASDRFVNILPEIDVPAHSLAAVASYPELSCTPGTYMPNSGDKFMVWEKGGFYALIDNTLCPANEATYTFLDKVFSEVADLFPFGFIHVGGDEAYKGFWEKSEAVQKLMQREGLKNMDAVQSYFIGRVQKIIQSKGKKMIGWDEILDGGLSKGATVMGWRGMKGGITAAKKGHQVVMTPNTFVYFDLYQGDPVAEPPTYSMVRLSKAYQFNPMPPGVDSSLILGAQCNLWSERLNTMRHAEYMLWPRAMATAESVWSPDSLKDWTSFYHRVEHHFKRLDMAETKYSRSMYDPIFSTSNNTNDSMLIHLHTEIEGLTIHYSFDETEPDKFYPVYTHPLLVPRDAAHLKVITYRDGVPVGKQIIMPISELRKRNKK